MGWLRAAGNHDVNFKGERLSILDKLAREALVGSRSPALEVTHAYAL